MQTRFAAIPKCASRSLLALGLLGEVDGRPHSLLKEYPNWDTYQWMVVDRKEDEWLTSWWLECKRTKNMFAHWAGFEYESLSKDLDKLNHLTGEAPVRIGLNSWVTPDFPIRFKQSGLSLKEYCYSVITCGVDCAAIDIDDLDAWLIQNGLIPIHKNRRDV